MKLAAIATLVVAALACAGTSAAQSGALPDLIVTMDKPSPAVWRVGVPVTVTDRVANTGTARAAQSRVRFYLARSGRRTRVGGRAVPALLPGAHSGATTSLRVSSAVASGTYRLVACADDLHVVAEANEANNCRTSISAVEVTHDTTPPTSRASVASAVTRSSSIPVSYTANGTGSALAKVELYVRRPGAATFARTATDAHPAASGHRFNFLAGADDGTYAFYTRAYDHAGNVEAAPASPDASAVVDRAAPTSSASAPSATSSPQIQVGYSANGTGSGLSAVDLYAKGPGDQAYTLVGSQAFPLPSGQFDYTLPNDGSYSFYTVARDAAGNQEPPPAPRAPDATTTLDDDPPQVGCDSPDGKWHSPQASIHCTATDAGSGLEHPADASLSLYTSVTAGTETANASTGSQQVCDKAGNCATAGPIAGNMVDSKAPTVSCDQADGSWHAGDVSVHCTASDSGSGLASSADADFSLSTSVGANTETANASTASRSVCDAAGNCTPAGPIGGNMVDKKAPSVSCPSADGAWHAQNVSFNCSAGDAGSGLADPTHDASFSVATNVATDTETSNASTGSHQVCDNVGNCVSRSVTGNKVDRKAPTVSCASADSSWHASNVSLGCTATDGGSGLQNPGDASFSLSTSVASGSFDSNASTGSRQVCDATTVNCATGGPIGGNMVDRSVPTSQATGPSQTNSTSIQIDYTASDTGSGLDRVELWVKRPGDSTFALASTDNAPVSGAHFTYSATAGDGSYAFYTRAYDKAGNAEAAPGSADVTTALDATAPNVTVSSPADGTIPDSVGLAGNVGTATGDTHSVTVDVFAGTTAAGTPIESPAATVSNGAWSAMANPNLYTPTASPSGTYTIRVRQSDSSGNTGTATSTFRVTRLLAAGDIAPGLNFSNTDPTATGDLVRARFGVAAPLGDNAYENGTTTEFTNYYDPTWGSFLSRTEPAVGNHEYNTTNATGYYGYFGSRAGDPAKGYYSYDLGNWHIVVLNTNDECKVIACKTNTAQITWLDSDLASSSKPCTLAYFHHPLWSSSTTGTTIQFRDGAVSDIWTTLQAHHADVVVNGHQHNYERFALQDGDGTADSSNGIREFVVGTGGHQTASPKKFGTSFQANSQAHDDSTEGILDLTLDSSSYSWSFLPSGSGTFTDSSSSPTSCHAKT